MLKPIILKLLREKTLNQLVSIVHLKTKSIMLSNVINFENYKLLILLLNLV